jgi:hypothetical protein
MCILRHERRVLVPYLSISHSLSLTVWFTQEAHAACEAEPVHPPEDITRLKLCARRHRIQRSS